MYIYIYLITFKTKRKAIHLTKGEEREEGIKQKQ